MLEVCYEDLVADREAQTRRILTHCGLDRDPLCLHFPESDRKVMTASTTQVRRPIYRASVRKWRRSEARLGPLLEVLGDLAVGGRRDGALPSIRGFTVRPSRWRSFGSFR